MVQSQVHALLRRALTEKDLAARVAAIDNVMTDAALVHSTCAWHGLRIVGLSDMPNQKMSSD